MPGASLTVDSPQPPARAWLGAAALTIAVFAACWTGALIYWRASAGTPSALAAGQLLLGLPAAILLALWMGKSALSARAAGAAQAAPAALALAAEPVVSLPAIAAAAVRLRGGESLAELAETLRANAAPCALDAELTDGAGYPVLSGRAACADGDGARAAMAPWLAQRALAEPDFSDEQWRALSMAAAVAGELAQHALYHPLLDDYQTAAAADRAAVALPVLQLLPLLPASWQDAQRHAGADWLLHLVQQQGWPAERLALAPAPAHDAGFALLETLAQPGLTLLLACESAIGEDSVRELEDRGLLFSGKTGRGQVPGEGAAGLLLADAAQAALLTVPVLAVLDGAGAGRHTGAADAKFDSALLAGLGREALAAGKTDAAALATLCADADFRPHRMAELIGAAGALLPELDLAGALLAVGPCCGSSGAAGTLAALALAAHEAQAGGAPVLCLSNSDNHYRCAVVVRPA